MLNPPVMLNLFQQLLSHAEKPANQNKIFHQTLTSPLHPNKINFRSVSRRRKFGIISPTTPQSANQQIRKSANPPLPSQAQQPANPNKIFRATLTSPFHPNKINF